MFIPASTAPIRAAVPHMRREEGDCSCFCRKQDRLLQLTSVYGTTERVLHPMQVVLNAAARLVVGAGRRDHITPILRELHWLPIRQRIRYKMAVLAFHCIHQSAPTYLSEMSPEVRTPR